MAEGAAAPLDVHHLDVGAGDDQVRDSDSGEPDPALAGLECRLESSASESATAGMPTVGPMAPSRPGIGPEDVRNDEPLVPDYPELTGDCHRAERGVTAELSQGAVPVEVPDAEGVFGILFQEHNAVCSNAAPTVTEARQLPADASRSPAGSDRASKKHEVVSRPRHFPERPLGEPHAVRSVPGYRPPAKAPNHPDRLANDLPGHLARTLGAVNENDRDLDDPEALSPDPEVHLDLKRVTV